MKSSHPFLLIAVIFVFCMTTFMASMVEARGGRGGGGGMRGGGGGMRGGGGGGGMRGGGFSRGGPAAGGGFTSRPAVRQPTRQAPRQESRQAPRQETRRQLSVDREMNRGGRDEAREGRQKHRDEVREKRQDYRDDAREDRQDYLDDRWDDHHDHHYGGAAVMTGTVGFLAGYNYVTSVPCETVVIVGKATYYNCSSAWYWRAMEGGELVYLIVPAPPGY